MDVNYELYKVFYYVASTLSFSEAASQLFISQSAVSQSIKTLEKKLNQTFFIRSTKKVQLTPEMLCGIFQDKVRESTGKWYRLLRCEAVRRRQKYP